MSIEAMKLTDPHDHPEPHTMKWTQLEMDYINKRVENAVRQAIEQAEQAQPVAYVAQLIEALYENSDPVSVEAAEYLEKHTSPPPRQPLTDEHVTDGTKCWCEPELDYKDPDTGAEVWIHRGKQ